MPIIGLTDRRATFPSIGTIRKGAPKPESGNRPGKDLTYFRLDTNDDSCRVLWDTLYPTDERARAIEVFLPFKEIEDCFEAWQEHWVAGGLVHRCDGERVVIRQNGKGEYETFEPGKGPECPGKCAPVGRLSVILPQMRRMVSLTVLTSSKHDILNLMSNLLSYYDIRQNLRGIPFVLRRVKKAVSTPGTQGKRVRREKWLLQLEPAQAWVSAQLELARRDAMPELEVRNGEYRMLPAPPDEWPDEEEPEWQAGEEPETEPEPEPEPEPKQTNDKSTSRPWTAEHLREYMQKRAAPMGASPTDKQLNAARAALGNITTDDDKRHSITAYLFGKDSTKDLTSGECSALIAWIDAKPPDYQPCGFAIDEAERVIRARVVEVGQAEMELEA